MQSFSYFDGHQIGIYPKGPAFSVKAKRGNHRNDLFVQEEFQDLYVDAFNFSGILKIDTADDTKWMSNDAVRVSRSQIDLSQTFHYLVGQPNGHVNRDLERCFIHQP